MSKNKAKKNILLLEKLRKLRIINKKTMDDLATQLNMGSGQNYSNYEIGKCRLTVEHLQKLSKIYNVPSEFLLDNSRTISLEDHYNNSKILKIEDNNFYELLEEFVSNYNCLTEESLNSIKWQMKMAIKEGKDLKNGNNNKKVATG